MNHVTGMISTKRVLAALALAGTVVPMGSAAASSPCDEPLKFGWEAWPPYQFKADGKLQGIDVDIARALADETGCEVEWTGLPWKRHLKMVDKGTMDAAMAGSYTKERDTYITYSEPYLPYESILWVSAENDTEYTSLVDFLDEGNALGVARGYTYGEDTDKLLKMDKYADQVTRNDKVMFNIRMAAKGRIQGTLGNRYTIAYRAKENNIRNKIRATKAVVQSSDIHIMWSEESVPQKVVDAWDNAIVKLKENGTFQEIVNKYTKASGS